MADQKGEAARWAQVGATIFLGVVGLILTLVMGLQQEKNRKNQMELQEKNRNNQMAVQMMSQREQSEIDFRQKMFGVLVAELLNSKVDVHERVTRLKLFQHNFHDIFNGRALFDVLEKEAKNLPKQEQDEVIKELVSLAKEVTVRQELLVGAKAKIFKVKVNDEVMVHIGKQQKGHHEQGENHTDTNECEHKISIKLLKVEEHWIKVNVTIDAEKEQVMELEFKVSFYDAPFTDNTLLPDKHRFAITLKKTNMETDPPEATFHVFEFPADYVTTGYRPSIREANKMIEAIQ